MEEMKNSLIEEYKEFLVSDVYFSDEEKKKGILSVPSHKEVADWWLKKLDLAVSKERERIVEILENNRNETLWGDEESNEVAKKTIDQFIVVVKDELNTK